MEDTSNYPNIQNYFSAFDIEDFLKRNDPTLNLSEISTEFTSIVGAIKYYIENTDFRGTIPFNLRNDIDSSYIQNLTGFINNVISDRTTPSTFVAQKPSRITSEFRPYHQNLYEYLYKPYVAYRASIEDVTTRNARFKEVVDIYQAEKTALTTELAGLKDQTNEFKRDYADLIKRVSSDITTADLGDYFHRLYNGKTIAEEARSHEDLKEQSLKKAPLRHKTLLLTTAIVSYVLFQNRHSLYTAYQYIVNHLVGFCVGSALVLLIACLTIGLVNRSYIGLLIAKYKLNSSSYQFSANKWAIATILFSASAAIIGFIVIRLETSGGGEITWQEIVLRAGVLLAPAYLARISMANYRANRHQAVLYRHRATVFSNMVGLENTINRDSNSAEMKKLYSEVTAFMFAMGDTGFLNKDQGAGNNDDMFGVIKDYFGKG